MSYCINCGEHLEKNFKFCSSCGNSARPSQTQNRIDKGFSTIQKNISSVHKEFSESETINKVSEKSEKLINKVLRVFGVLGLITLSLMFLNPLITGNDFVIKSAYETNINVMGIFKSYAGFFGEIFVTIIAPLLLIFIGFKENSTIQILTILLTMGLTIYTITLFN